MVYVAACRECFAHQLSLDPSPCQMCVTCGHDDGRPFGLGLGRRSPERVARIIGGLD